MAGGEAACQPARKKTGRLSPAGKAGSSACGAASPAFRLRDDERLYHMSWPDYAVILSSRLLFLSLVAPSAPGCLTASGRQARLRRAAAGAPARLRRTRWRGFGLRYGLMREHPACSDRSGRAPLSRRKRRSPHPLRGVRSQRRMALLFILPLPLLRPVPRSRTFRGLK